MRPGGSLVFGLACALLLAALPAAAQLAKPGLSADRLIVGIGRSIHDPEGAARATRLLDVHAIRLDAPWQSIETAPGKYRIPGWLDAAVDAALRSGMEPLLIFAYGHPLHGGDKPRTPAAIAAFARYAAYVTAHYEGRVRYFDLWNEWNTHTGRTTPGSAEGYVELARRVYPAVKAANPDAVVLSGGITSSGLRDGWIEAFIAAGGLEYVDGLSVHPYNYLDGAAATPEDALDKVERAYALTVAAGQPRPVYVTEMGYPSFPGRGGVSEELAAEYLARFVLMASTRPYIVGVWWYCLRDHGTDARNKEHHFGVLDTLLLPKPAGSALRAVARLLDEVGRFEDLSHGAQRRIAAERSDGSSLVLAWEAGGADTSLLDTLTGGAQVPFEPGRARR